MNLLCFHAYALCHDLASDEHPQAVTLRKLLGDNPTAAARYADLGPVDRSVLGVSCLVLGGAPVAPVTPPAKYQQEWSLEAYLAEETEALPALALSEYMRKSTEIDGKVLSLLQPLSVLHVSFQDIDSYFDVVAASCAPTTLFPYAWRQKADKLQFRTEQLDLLFSNLIAARTDDKELLGQLQPLYAKVCARSATVPEEMECLLVASQLLGVY
jgi:hypothetical protein